MYPYIRLWSLEDWDLFTNQNSLQVMEGRNNAILRITIRMIKNIIKAFPTILMHNTL
jgi:hypothetical protein